MLGGMYVVVRISAGVVLTLAVIASTEAIAGCVRYSEGILLLMTIRTPPRGGSPGFVERSFL